MEKIVRLGWAVANGDPTHADYSITILSQPANHTPKTFVAQGSEPVGTSSQPEPTQPTAVAPKGEHATRTGADLATNPASSGWQSWQELAGDANHTKSSNDKHSGVTVGKLAHLGMQQKKANNEAYGDPIADWDPSSPKTVEPEPPSLPRQPADDVDSSQQSRQRCETAGHNAGVNGRRVRFLDRDPVPPSFRGKEAQVERDTPGLAIVWVEGKRRHVLKQWLVEESDTSTSASQP
jgi:hypothetical protein